MWPSITRNKSITINHPALEFCSLEEADKIELLSAMDIFRGLPQEEIGPLMNTTSMLTAKKGTEIYGFDGPEVLFLLKSGRVELYRQSVEGKKLTLAYVEQGTFFGEMSLIGQRLVGTCAVAVEDSVICALSRHDMESLMLEYPVIALRVIGVLAGRLQQTRVALQERRS